MGRRNSCPGDNIPPRPEHELCLYNGGATASCFNSRANPNSYIRPILEGDFVTNIVDYQEQEKWVKFILDSCRGK